MNDAPPLRLLYVTFGENILESGILYCQVREMLQSMVRLNMVSSVELVSFVSIRLWFRKRKAFRKLQSDLHDHGINFHFPFALASQKWSFISIPIALLTSLPVLSNIVPRGKPTIIHARSYMASYLSMIVAKKFRIPFIFDTRGPYPEEMVTNNRWQASGLTYKIWKRIEHRMMRDCGGNVSVTTQMRTDAVEAGCKRSIFVPNRTNVGRFLTRRDNFNITEEFKLIFTGELDTKYYTPSRIASVYLKLKSIVPQLKLVLITRRNKEYVENGLLSAGVRKEDWALKSGQPEEMPNLLLEGHLGLIVSISGDNPWDIFPVKLAEYLAAGIPVLVDRNAGMLLCNIIEQNGLGATYDMQQGIDAETIITLIGSYQEISRNCRRYSEMKLDISHSAKQYARLYRQVLVGQL